VDAELTDEMRLALSAGDQSALLYQPLFPHRREGPVLGGLRGAVAAAAVMA
jgi:hypothetical protein